MKLSAFDAIDRGLKNVRANWQLVIVQIVQNFAIAALVIAGFVSIVLVIGVGFLRDIFQSGNLRASRPPDLEPMLEAVVGNLSSLLWAFLGASCLWTVAFLIYCYLQAGIFGQLAEGEACAKAAARGRAEWRAFRTFNASRFRQAAGRGVWKFFWLINIFVGLGLIVTFAFAAVIGGLVIAAFENGPGPLLFVVGCSSALFFVPLWIIFVSWSQMSKAEVASAAVRGRGGAGIFSAVRNGLRLTFQRIGAVLLTLLLGFVATIALSVVFVPLSLAADFALGDSWTVQTSADVLLGLVQSAFGGVVGLIYAAVFVSLAFWRGDSSRLAEERTE